MKRGVLAFVGDNPRDAVRSAASRAGLVEVDAGSGLLLFVGTALPVRDRAGDAAVKGVTVGDVFAFPGAGNSGSTAGWGSYLSFSRAGAAVRIERAPLTGLPLYWFRYLSGVVLTSHLDLIADFIGGIEIDWEFVAHAISHINLRTERTGLCGLSELLPGSELEIEGARVSVRSTWSPWDYANRPTALDFADMTRELERRLIDCTRAWGSERGKLLLELSGGVDSSIVAAALHGAGFSFRAINFVTPRGDGDERFYARAVADHMGAALIEAELGFGKIDLVAPPDRLTPRPASYAVLGSIDAAFERAAASGDDTILGGIGGDNIFGFDGSVAPILDAFAAFGISRRTLGALRDVARAGDATAWTALRLARRAALRGPRTNWRRETLFVNEAAVPERPFAHPWDEGAAGAPPGRRNHVEAVMRILDFLDRPARWHDRDVIAPLLSQPVVEFCLTIPSWTWVRGGRDRAVARAAFAPRLPPEVIWRRGKGRIESVAASAYQAQRADVRELLFGGRLASSGLIDRHAIATYLGRDLTPGDFDYYRLLEIADVERWVRALEASPLCGPSFDQR